MSRRPPPAAEVRTRVPLPVRRPDGGTTHAVVTTFDGLVDGREHVAITYGEPGPAPLVRVHSECLTGDVLGSQRCDCGPQLLESVERLCAEGGHLLYLRQEGRGIGLYNKLDAYVLQDAGLDTFEANLALGFGPDERDYTVAAQMLRALGATGVRLLTDNAEKVDQLGAAGIVVVEVVPMGVHESPANARYLDAKRRRTGHRARLRALEG